MAGGKLQYRMTTLDGNRFPVDEHTHSVVPQPLKLIKDKRLTTPIFTHFEIQASWSYFSVLSLTGVKRNDYILPEIMSRPSKAAFMSFKRGFSEFRQ